MSNKSVFANNLNRYMKENRKTRKEVCEALGFSYFTFSDWCNGKKYPRMDKVEMLAKYFGVLKSDLIEDKTEEQRKMQKNNDVMADIIVRMRTDEDFLSVVEAISKLDKDKISSLLALLK